MTTFDTPTAKEIECLERLAMTAAARSYAPYSRFYVGAAILLAGGECVAGCNVENASYRLTTCAEQNAIAAAIGLHGPRIRIRAIVVVNQANVSCAPCGACRQMISEFGGEDASVVFPGANGARVRTTAGELLPGAFKLKPA